MGVVINNLTFNQDYSCLSVSTNRYHKIFNCDPFGEFYSSNSQSFKKSLTNSIGNDHDLISSEIKKIDDNSNDDDDDIYPTAYLRMLFSTSLTIIIPQSFSKLGNRLLKIYNLKQRLKICELTFPSNIIDIKLNRKRLVVFLEIGQIYIYDLSCVRLIKVLEINSYLHDSIDDDDDDSPRTITDEFIGDLSTDDKSYLVLPISVINEQTDLFNSNDNVSSNGDVQSSPLIKPSDSAIVNSLNSVIGFTQKNKQSSLSTKEHISLEDLKKDSNGWILIYDTINLQPKLIYKAHDASIAKITISNDSFKIASASTKGTIIRVCHLKEEFESTKLKIIQITNLRRGHNLARINALSFSLDNTILGCGSESNTIHFFNLVKEDSNQEEITTDDSSYKNSELNENESVVTSNNDEDDSGRSSEDLNENLANLLISKRPSNATMTSNNSAGEDPIPNNEDAELSNKNNYFSLNTLKKTTKLINNQYTKSIIKNLPYREYFDNLIWEPPRRSFAYIKLPEYTPPSFDTRHKNHQTLGPSSPQSIPHPSSDSKHKVEIGFTNTGIIMLASYQTGNFYHYQLPKHDLNDDSREECYLINQYTLL